MPRNKLTPKIPVPTAVAGALADRPAGRAQGAPQPPQPPQAPQPSLEQQVQVLVERLQQPVVTFTVAVHRGTNAVYAYAGGDWGGGAAGLRLIVDALNGTLEEMRRQLMAAEVAEQVAAQGAEARRAAAEVSPPGPTLPPPLPILPPPSGSPSRPA